MGAGFDSRFPIGCLSLKVDELIAEEMIVGLGVRWFVEGA
jgi:hypothetical protein